MKTNQFPLFKIPGVLFLFLCQNSLTAQTIPSSISLPGFTSEVGAICISGINYTWAAKAAIDAYAIRTCSHYWNQLLITNAERTSSKYMEEETLIASYKSRLRKFIAETKGKEIDLFIFGHGNYYSEPIADLFYEVEREFGILPQLRLVYNSGYGNFEPDYLLRRMARTYVGHRESNIGATFSPLFLEGWFTKVPVSWALEVANTVIENGPFNEDSSNDPKGYLTGDSSLTF